MADLDSAPAAVASPQTSPQVSPATPVSSPLTPAKVGAGSDADTDADTKAEDEDVDKSTRPTTTLPRAGTGTTATSAPLGAGLLPDLGSDEDESSAITSSGRALQPLGTRTMTAEEPIDTGPSLGDKISEVADDCTQPGKSCRSSFNQTLGVSLGAVRECLQVNSNA